MGRPKAWLPLAGEPLLVRVARVLASAADPVVVVAAADQDLPPLPPGVLVARDEVPDQGPLAGLAAGLAALAGRAEVAFATSCDAPFLELAFVGRLVERLGDCAAAVPLVDGRRYPLSGVYRVDLLPTVRGLLAAGQRRLLDLLDAVPTRLVTADELRAADPRLRSLVNVNTPEEYAAAVREVDSPPPLP
jgi:molybdopterin-guanine dinucleotide biosynthesis protein A